MRSLKLLTIALLCTLAASTSARKLDIIPDATFALPTDTVHEATFRDIDSDGWPEVLLVGGDSIWLYSLAYDSVLFAANIPDPSRDFYTVTLADVNRDSIADLILGSLDTAFTRVDVWDGGSGYTAVDSVVYGPLYHYWNHSIVPGIVATTDLDEDGFGELIVSFEEQRYSSSGFTTSISRGTVVYASFPDSQAHSSHLMSIQLDSLIDRDGTRLRYLTVNRMWVAEFPGTDYHHVWSYPVTVSVDSMSGKLIPESADPLPAPSDDDVSVFETLSRWRIKCGGDLQLDSPGSEFLVTREMMAAYACWSGPCPFEPIDSTELYLFSLIDADSTEEIWHKDISGQNWEDFLYHQGFPGYFFAFVDGDFVMYDVTSDTIFQTNDDVPVGERSWTWPCPDKLPRLVTLDANHVTLYRLDISTTVGDQPGGELPESFTISEPYPNPFNPTVSFSISLPMKTNLTIEVFNTLGQRVERLFEGDLAAGEKLFQWDGTDYASGVYLIKASTESESKSVKAVLVK